MTVLESLRKNAAFLLSGLLSGILVLGVWRQWSGEPLFQPQSDFGILIGSVLVTAYVVFFGFARLQREAVIMSVRRLAEKQPESFEFTPENRAWLDAQIAKYPPGRQASAVIPALWQAQKQHDYWLPQKAIEKVADLLDMPYIRVLEIATFYTMFNLEPVGKYFIQLCGTTPCMLRGSDDLIRICEDRIGEQRHVTADGLFSWLEVECLGACCNAPMVQINDDYYEDLDAANFTRCSTISPPAVRSNRPAEHGRLRSEPLGGLTALTEFYGADGKSGPLSAPQTGEVRRRGCFRTRTASSRTFTAMATGAWKARRSAAPGMTPRACSKRARTGSSTK